MIHFDTNFLISALQIGTPEQVKITRWLLANESLNVNAVAWAEFLAGPLSGTDEKYARLFFSQPEPLTSGDAEFAATLFNNTGRRSRSLADCMIAATAIRCGAQLATLNSTDFAPFTAHGLILA